jgi:hypothetical protein
MKRFALFGVAAFTIAACGSTVGRPETATRGDAFCKLALTANDDNDALDNVDPTNPTEVKLQLSAAIDSLSAVAAKAPRDITDTVNELLANEEKLESLLKANGFDFTKFSESEEGKKLLDDKTITQAGDDLHKYLRDKCGIATDTTTPSDSTPADDTIAPADTIVSLDTIVSGGSSVDTIVDLGEGEAAINKFLDFFELGTSTKLTQDDRDCLVGKLVNKVTGAELNQAIAGNPSDEVQLALGRAFIDCKIDVQS